MECIREKGEIDFLFNGENVIGSVGELTDTWFPLFFCC
jgi:hypothetical protein